MTDSKRRFARMELSQDKDVLGQLLIEIFTDECPKTTAHFIKLLTANRDDGEYGYQVSSSLSERCAGEEEASFCLDLCLGEFIIH
jgi:hypothetical protein